MPPTSKVPPAAEVASIIATTVNGHPSTVDNQDPQDNQGFGESTKIKGNDSIRGGGRGSGHRGRGQRGGKGGTSSHGKRGRQGGRVGEGKGVGEVEQQSEDGMSIDDDEWDDAQNAV